MCIAIKLLCVAIVPYLSVVYTVHALFLCVKQKRACLLKKHIDFLGKVDPPFFSVHSVKFLLLRDISLYTFCVHTVHTVVFTYRLFMHVMHAVMATVHGSWITVHVSRGTLPWARCSLAVALDPRRVVRGSWLGGGYRWWLVVVSEPCEEGKGSY